MSGIFAAIFGLLGSKKWIARLGRAGISRQRGRGADGEGRKKSLALREPLMGAERSSGALPAGMTDLAVGVDRLTVKLGSRTNLPTRA